MAKRKANTDLEQEEYSFKNDQELRAALKEVGIDPGPVNSSNRIFYIRHYAQKRRKLEAEAFTDGSSSFESTPQSESKSSSSKLKGKGGSASSTPKQKEATKKVGRRTADASSEQAIRNFQLEGLIAAVYTPFKDNKTKDVNFSAIEGYAQHLLSNGVKGVFVNGTTGEGLSLTLEERKQVAEHWVRVGAGRLKIVVHVGTENLKNTCELTKQAVQIGASAIGVMPTTFFKPSSIEVLVQYLSEVADSAPNLPMYYYHIPAMTGVTFSMEEFLDVASTRLPTLRGVKFTDTNLFEFGRCVTAQEGRYQIIFGCDEQLIAALSLGGTSAIGSTYNFAGKLYNRLLSAYANKDTEAAKLEQRRSQAMLRIYFNYGSNAKGLGKTIMKLCGVDCGPPRLPYTSLAPDQVKKLKEDLDDIGFFFWC